MFAVRSVNKRQAGSWRGAEDTWSAEISMVTVQSVVSCEVREVVRRSWSKDCRCGEA